MEKLKTHLEEELSKLKNEITKMAGMVTIAIEMSIRSLKERNPEIAEKVIAMDKDVDHMEVKIDNFCLRLLALYQPAAEDLRFITSAMKINNDLERMADLSVNIAEASVELNKEPELKPLIDIPVMAEIAQEMVNKAITSFINKDTASAIAVRKEDFKVDNLNDQIFRELLTCMISDPNAVNRAIYLLLVGRNLERIADHSTNIGEDVVYMVTGKTIAHTKK
jgi:phosphate transport system protein